MANEEKAVNNPCSRVLPGSCDCQNQVNKNNCVFQKENQGNQLCLGRTGVTGANVEKGRLFVAEKIREKLHSLGDGFGHLSDARAMMASQTPQD